VRISDARQKMLTAQNLKSIMVSRLNNVLVRPLNSDIQAVDMDGPPYDIGYMDIEKAWEIAEKKRVEIEIVNETMKSLDLEERSARAEYYPTFFAKGGYDYTENRYQLHEGNWSILLGMDLNLYSGDRTRSSILKLGQQKDRLLEQKNKLIDDIKLEVKKYVLDSRTAKKRMAVTRDAVRQAEENLRINRVKYEEGAGTATDVIDAVTLLTTAETNYYRALYDLRKAEAGVLYATGQELSEVYK
jgi:outer membrane protein